MVGVCGQFVHVKVAPPSEFIALSAATLWRVASEGVLPVSRAARLFHREFEEPVNLAVKTIRKQPRAGIKPAARTVDGRPIPGASVEVVGVDEPKIRSLSLGEGFRGCQDCSGVIQVGFIRMGFPDVGLQASPEFCHAVAVAGGGGVR